MRDKRIVRIAAGFSELNTMTRTGLYPVLFNAVVGMAGDANGPLIRARQRICEEIGNDAPANVKAKLVETRLKIAPTSQALRPDLLQIFAEAPDEMPNFLGTVSSASQIRSGLQYLDFAMIALAAAGVQKFFLMIDQLEDLATNKTLARARRRREIGRVRDLMETEPYASMLHMTFTFHATAARELETFWEEHRLPSFEDTPSNQAAVVVLRGMQDDDQVEALLCAWLDAHRFDDSTVGGIVPFEREALTVLRQVSEGRPGILLNRANELLQAGSGGAEGTHRRNVRPRIFCRSWLQHDIASDRGRGASERRGRLAGLNTMLATSWHTSDRTIAALSMDAFLLARHCSPVAFP